MNRKLKFVSMILALFFLAGMLVACGTFGINLDSKEKKYLGARTELNLLLEQYIQIQNSVSDSDHEKAKAAFVAADQALDTWELMLNRPDYDFTKDIQTWLKAKNIILEIMRGIYG